MKKIILSICFFVVCILQLPALCCADDVADLKRQRNLILGDYRNATAQVFDNNAQLKFSRDTAKLVGEKIRDNQLGPVYGHLKSAAGVYGEIADGNWSGAKQKLTQIAASQLIPGFGVYSAIEEGWGVWISAIESGIADNNAGVLRRTFREEVFPSCKAPEWGLDPASCPRSAVKPWIDSFVDMSFRGELTMDMGSAGTGTGNILTVLGLGKNKEDFSENRVKAAIHRFYLNDPVIRRMLQMKSQGAFNKRRLESISKALKKAEKNVHSLANDFRAKREKEERVRQEARAEANKLKNPVAKMLSASEKVKLKKQKQQITNIANNYNNQISSLQESYKAAMDAFDVRMTELFTSMSQEIKLYDLGHFYRQLSSGSNPLPETDVDSEQVDWNRSTSEKKEKEAEYIARMAEYTSLYQDVLAQKRSIIEELSSTAKGLESTWESWSEAARSLGVKMKDPLANSYAVSALNLGVKNEQLKSQLSQQNMNVAQLQQEARALESAAEKGAKSVEALMKKDFEPVFDEFQEDYQKHDEANRQLSRMETERLVTTENVMTRLISTNSLADVEGMVNGVEADHLEYGEIVRRRGEILDRLDDSSSKMSSIVNSDKYRSASGYFVNTGKAYHAPSSPQERKDPRFDLNTIRPIVSKVASANRYLADGCRRIMQDVDKILNEFSTTEMMYMWEDDFQRVFDSEIAALIAETESVWMKALKKMPLNKLSEIKPSHWRRAVPGRDYFSQEALALLAQTKDYGNARRVELTKTREAHVKANQPSWQNVQLGGHPVDFGHSAALQVSRDDIDNGTLTFRVEMQGNPAFYKMRLQVDGVDLPVEQELRVSGNAAQVAFNGTIPVEGRDSVDVSYSIGKNDSSHMSTTRLIFPVAESSGAKTAIEELYRNFKDSYSNQNLSGLMMLISSDWGAPDGSDIDDLEESLDNSFMVFDRITYNIKGLSIKSMGNGVYSVNYSGEIRGDIYASDLKHVEKSSVSEMVGVEDGQWRILRTSAGRFWRE